MLTDAAIRKRKPDPEKRVEVHDANGLYLVIQQSGAKSWAYRYRAFGKSKKLTLGSFPAIGIAEARKLAADAAVKLQRGTDPILEKKQTAARAGNTVNALLDAFVADHVVGLRSARQIVRCFDKYVRPRIGARSIYSLKRSDIAAMLTAIKTNHGAVMADRVLACVSKAFSWQMLRDDGFVSPIIRGMATTKPAERARTRILADDEIRDLWHALERCDDFFARFVKLLLLATARRTEVSDMHASEIKGDVWTVPANRYKNGKDHSVPLTPTLRELIGANPKGFVFSTTNGEKPFSSFSKTKLALDKEINRIRAADGRSPMPHWQLHDLRRTGRSLMSRAGVNPDHAERCMGHTIAGVRGVYDHHQYLEEKRVAFEKLASLLAVILNPTSNVIALRG